MNAKPSSSTQQPTQQPMRRRSIGEVLELLQSDFSDITISKIRFLESQGLIQPERAPSGYRKFSDADIARLRWVLEQQRQHFLPLKVIKDRLGESHREQDLVASTSASAQAQQPQQQPETSPSAPRENLSRAELLNQSGLSEEHVRALEGFGLLTGQRSTTGIWYDERAVALAGAAAQLLKFGVEVRHLRIFKTAADREADLYGQLLAPMRAQRSVEARHEVSAATDELLRLGEVMRMQLLRQALERRR